MPATTLITTSIAYVNGDPHVGFAMESIEADCLARHRRSRGHQTCFLTGTDEHGSKIYRVASQEGITPQALTDRNSARFRQLGQLLDLSTDDFIRTSEARHKKGAQEIWKRIAQSGDLEERAFEGLYCVGCEAFLTEKELADGKCPNHLVAPELLTERNIFFKLSKYSGQIVELIESEKIRILPEFRAREIIQFAKEGLKDISFSRPKSSLPWGIPVPGDDEQVMYVWCDALTNYITAVGFGTDDRWRDYWESGEVIHFIGKDILRFHAAIWPAMLLSADLPLPKTICVHGFLTSEGQKMSKSLGNVVDPVAVVHEFDGNPDPLRYFLLAEVPFGRDADFSRQRFLEIYNAKLANGLGNLFSRVMTLARKAGLRTVPDTIADVGLRAFFDTLPAKVDAAMRVCELHEAIAAVFAGVELLNLDIDAKKPWLKMKADPEAANPEIGDWLKCLSLLQVELEPFLPRTAVAMAKGLNEGEIPMLFPRKEA